MTSRGVVDVVFCLDVSGSMKPCIEAVKTHVVSFVEALASDGQRAWDVRLDFVAYRAGQDRVWLRSARSADLVAGLYRDQASDLFVGQVEDFRRALALLDAEGDEASLIALDCSLDFPWRPRRTCHRVVILLTDEPLEGGCAVSKQTAAIPALIGKIQSLGVMLFMVAPQSPAFEAISAVDKSEYHVVEATGDGLTTVDFAEVLSYIGKSVSKSQGAGAGMEASVARGLFGQQAWRALSGGWFLM